MRKVAFSVVILLSCGFVLSAGSSSSSDPDGLVVHEWGTFTSVAGDNGTPEEWVPQIGPSELPCFIERASFSGKGWLPATVRMETPVLYFYSPVDREVDVRVKFRRGLITEWYPRADVAPRVIGPLVLREPSLEGTIAWKRVKVSPRGDETYPGGGSTNHYYAARATDAAPVVVGDQREKFLFYRGVGSFGLPVTARLLKDGRVTVTPAENQSVSDVMLFENRDGVTRFVAAQPNSSELTMVIPSAAGKRAAVSAALEAMLVKHGLYAKEAAAMVATWRDSWFEEGTRLFYIAPRAAVDYVLPLDVSPAPANIARVFVGRIELITPEVVEDVRTAMRNRDRATLLKYGRFLRPITARLSGSASPQWDADMQFAFSTVAPPAGGCR